MIKEESSKSTKFKISLSSEDIDKIDEEIKKIENDLTKNINKSGTTHSKEE
ncbi:MAG: hypothetical protein ACW9W3_04645 [Candidatus Nitrosopumilus sp. bin_68KS]